MTSHILPLGEGLGRSLGVMDRIWQRGAHEEDLGQCGPGALCCLGGLREQPDLWIHSASLATGPLACGGLSTGTQKHWAGGGTH